MDRNPSRPVTRLGDVVLVAKEECRGRSGIRIGVEVVVVVVVVLMVLLVVLVVVVVVVAVVPVLATLIAALPVATTTDLPNMRMREEAFTSLPVACPMAVSHSVHVFSCMQTSA